MTPTPAQQKLANETVRVMYSSFPLDALEELVEISEKYEAVYPQIVVVAMTIALKAEVKRRKEEANQ